MIPELGMSVSVWGMTRAEIVRRRGRGISMNLEKGAYIVYRNAGVCQVVEIGVSAEKCIRRL